MAKAWRYLCLALGIAGIARAIRLTALSWGQPWPDAILTIDGKSYLRGAVGATWGRLFEVHDFYHSPGYQLYLRAIFAALGSTNATIDASKLLSLAMFFASAVLLYRLSRRWFEPAVAQLAVAIFLCSESWAYYSNMIQYEVMTGFLILLILSILTSSPASRSSGILWIGAVMMGCLLAFISIIQMRYTVLLLIPLAYPALVARTELRNRKLRQGLIGLLTGLALLAGWSLAQSHIEGRTVFLMDGSVFRWHVANNPNALGYSFPYPQIVEPSGWQFIFAMPGQWLWLVGQRALYLSGIQRDIWALPPDGFRSGPIGSFSPLDTIGTIGFAAGLSLATWRIYRSELSSESIVAMLALACIILPPLLVFGSKRFIVPVIPLIALFQAYGIVEIATVVGRRIGQLNVVASVEGEYNSKIKAS